MWVSNNYLHTYQGLFHFSGDSVCEFIKFIILFHGFTIKH